MELGAHTGIGLRVPKRGGPGVRACRRTTVTKTRKAEHTMTGPDTHTGGFSPHVLREYALLADGERGALVGPRGDIAWMCAPQWDSEGVFSSLIGGAGTYAVSPAGTYVWGGFYEPGSLIWHNRWVTDGGIIECREALAFPGDRRRAVILRRIIACENDAVVHIVLHPQPGFGRHHARWTRTSDQWTAKAGTSRLRWTGCPNARPDTGGRGAHALVAELRLSAGEHHDLVLEIGDAPLPDTHVDAEEAWSATVYAWSQAVPNLTGTLADRDARHAYAVLRGLTSSGGGMVAAATLGLPERAEQGRNYDYRYVWLRDQCFAGQAVAATGPYPLLDDAVHFVTERVLSDGPKLAPAYTVTGNPVPDEHTLGLPGYPGGNGVAGNHVNAQLQLDVLGEALMLYAAAAEHDHLQLDDWRAVETAVSVIEQRWKKPEAGIWELDDRCWTESRLICVAGLRAISTHAPAAQAGRWLPLADAILSHTASTSLHPSGRWQRAPDDDRLDAALLLPPIRGAVAAEDPRTVATLEAVRSELAQEGYLYRFRQQPGPLADSEGAFLLCGFLMALATHQQGHQTEAMRWFERSRAACGPPGLFTEEFDVAQRQLRGNIPQAFVHALLLESSVRLARPWNTPRPSSG